MFAWMFRRRTKDAEPQERALWGDLMSLGMVFPLCIALGFFLGRWAGAKLGWPRLGIGLGLGWGIGAAFWELYKTAKRLERMDPPPGGGPGPQGPAGGSDDAR